MLASASDELQRYLALQIDKSTLSSSPLDFWKANHPSLHLPSKLARRIHSIPATTAAAERQFSGAGFLSMNAGFIQIQLKSTMFSSFVRVEKLSASKHSE